MTDKRKAKSPYQKYDKVPFRYSKLRGIEHKRMLVDRFGAEYWTRNGVRIFPAAAYESREENKP